MDYHKIKTIGFILLFIGAVGGVIVAYAEYKLSTVNKENINMENSKLKVKDSKISKVQDDGSSGIEINMEDESGLDTEIENVEITDIKDGGKGLKVDKKKSN